MTRTNPSAYIFSTKPNTEILLGIQQYITKNFPESNPRRVLPGYEKGNVFPMKGDAIILSSQHSTLGFRGYADTFHKTGKAVYVLFPNQASIQHGRYDDLDGILFRDEGLGFVGYVTKGPGAYNPMHAHRILQKTLQPKKPFLVSVK